ESRITQVIGHLQSFWQFNPSRFNGQNPNSGKYAIQINMGPFIAAHEVLTAQTKSARKMTLDPTALVEWQKRQEQAKQENFVIESLDPSSSSSSSEKNRSL